MMKDEFDHTVFIAREFLHHGERRAAAAILRRLADDLAGPLPAAPAPRLGPGMAFACGLALATLLVIVARVWNV